MPSRGARAVERAVAWVEERKPDLVCLTGDLLSRPGGASQLESLLTRLGRPYVVLGNHDLDISRDPFSRPAELRSLPAGRLLADSAEDVELRGVRVQLAGVDPRSWLARRGSGFGDSDAPLRILLCHFPTALDRVPEGRWHLLLAGHLHAGQIVIPLPGRSLRLSHLREPHVHGLYTGPPAVLHVSAGLGTTFVPFRFFARPEATDLVLRAAA